MSFGSFRHLMIFVSDFQESKAFYDSVLGFSGYTLAHGSDTYCRWNPTQGGCDFGIVQSPVEFSRGSFQRGTPGLHHLAFNAENRSQIDDLYSEVLQRIGATVLDPPGECPDYGPSY